MKASTRRSADKESMPVARTGPVKRTGFTLNPFLCTLLSEVVPNAYFVRGRFLTTEEICRGRRSADGRTTWNSEGCPLGNDERERAWSLVRRTRPLLGLEA